MGREGWGEGGGLECHILFNCHLTDSANNQILFTLFGVSRVKCNLSNSCVVVISMKLRAHGVPRSESTALNNRHNLIYYNAIKKVDI